MLFTEEEKKERKISAQAKWRKNNPEKLRAARKRWRIKYAEQIKKHKHDYYLRTKAEQTRKRKERAFNLKKEIIKAYSPEMKCANCGLTDLKNLTVDHINGKGEKHRKTSKISGGSSFYLWLKNLNFPPGYQILCFGCNMAKGMYGTI